MKTHCGLEYSSKIKATNARRTSISRGKRKYFL